MTEIHGVIRTAHANAPCVADALRVDNLGSMETAATETGVTTTITGTKLRSVIASVDDYLLNLGIAEEVSLLEKGHGGTVKDDDRRHGKRTDRT